MDESFCLPDLLVSIESETSPVKKLHSIETALRLVFNHEISNLQDELLCIVMPATRNLIESIFLRNIDCFNHGNLLDIKENLSMCLHIFDTIGLLVDYFIEDGTLDVASMRSVILNLFRIIYDVVLHCKERNESYKAQEENFLKILSLFTKTQEIHGKLLRLLEGQASFTNEKETLLELLDLFCEGGDILSGVNVKLLFSNWKTYTILIGKYAELIRDEIDVARPLNFISGYVLTELHKLVTLKNTGNLTQNVKICNFFIKVALKVMESFWALCKESTSVTLNFFVTLYSFKQTSDLQSDLADLIQNQIYSLIEPAAIKFFDETDVFTENFVPTEDIGFLNLVSIILRKVSLEAKRGSTENLLDAIFTSLLSNEFIPNGLVVTTVSKILSVDQNEFNGIENHLIKNLVDGDFNQKMFAFDVMLLLTRQIPPTLVYDQMLNITDNLIEIGWDESHDDRNIVSFLSSFLSETGSNLPNVQVAKYLEKYPLEIECKTWGSIGLNWAIKTKSFVPAAAIGHVIRCVNFIEHGEFELTDIENLAETLLSLSTLDASQLRGSSDLRKFRDVTLKLWSFDYASSDNPRSPLWSKLFEALLKITAALAADLSENHLYGILKQINALFPRISVNLWLPIIKLLGALSHLEITDFKISEQISILLEKILFPTDNFVLSFKSKRVKIALENTRWFGKLTKPAIRSSDKIIGATGTQVSDNVLRLCQNASKISETGIEVSENKLSVLKKTAFKRQNENFTFNQKKFKSDENLDHKFDATQDTIDLIKTEVKNLKKHSLRGNFKATHSNEIFKIISELQKLV